MAIADRQRASSCRTNEKSLRALRFAGFPGSFRSSGAHRHLPAIHSTRRVSPWAHPFERDPTTPSRMASEEAAPRSHSQNLPYASIPPRQEDVDMHRQWIDVDVPSRHEGKGIQRHPRSGRSHPRGSRRDGVLWPRHRASDRKAHRIGLSAFACRSRIIEAAIEALLLADPAHPAREMTQAMGRAEARTHDTADLEEDDR